MTAGDTQSVDCGPELVDHTDDKHPTEYELKAQLTTLPAYDWRTDASRATACMAVHDMATHTHEMVTRTTLWGVRPLGSQ